MWHPYCMIGKNITLLKVGKKKCFVFPSEIEAKIYPDFYHKIAFLISSNRWMYQSFFSSILLFLHTCHALESWLYPVMGSWGQIDSLTWQSSVKLCLGVQSSYWTIGLANSDPLLCITLTAEAALMKTR